MHAKILQARVQRVDTLASKRSSDEPMPPAIKLGRKVRRSGDEVHARLGAPGAMSAIVAQVVSSCLAVSLIPFSRGDACKVCSVFPVYELSYNLHCFLLIVSPSCP